MTDDVPSPLDVLLMAMRACLDQDDLKGAAAFARLAAPYVHTKPRPGGTCDDVRAMTDEELEALLGEDPEGTGAEGPGAEGADSG